MPAERRDIKRLWANRSALPASPSARLYKINPFSPINSFVPLPAWLVHAALSFLPLLLSYGLRVLKIYYHQQWPPKWTIPHLLLPNQGNAATTTTPTVWHPAPPLPHLRTSAPLSRVPPTFPSQPQGRTGSHSPLFSQLRNNGLCHFLRQFPVRSSQNLSPLTTALMPLQHMMHLLLPVPPPQLTSLICPTPRLRMPHFSMTSLPQPSVSMLYLCGFWTFSFRVPSLLPPNLTTSKILMAFWWKSLRLWKADSLQPRL